MKERKATSSFFVRKFIKKGVEIEVKVVYNGDKVVASGEMWWKVVRVAGHFELR